MQTAFVTGATGFLGINLVAELVARGWRVVALHRAGADIRALEGFPVERAVGDINDAASLEQAMPLDVDAVFHVAGSTNLWSRRNAEQDRINIDGTRNVVATALDRRARRFVHTSSISAYGIHDGRIDESTPMRGDRSPINYQRSKHAAELEVREGIARGLAAVILNPAGIIGPYDRDGYVRLFKLIDTGKLPGVPPGALSFCHVQEVARAHIAAAERGRIGENYLLGGADTTLLALVQAIGALLGKPVPARPTPPWLLRAIGTIGEGVSYVTGRPPALTRAAARMVTRSTFCDCSKAIRELGYRSVPLETMIGDCHRWLLDEGMVGARPH